MGYNSVLITLLIWWKIIRSFWQSFQLFSTGRITVRSSVRPVFQLGWEKGRVQKKLGSLAHEQPKFRHNLALKRQKIWRSLECERPKFGHNPAHERNEVWAQFCRRSMKTWEQISKQSKNTKQERPIRLYGLS